MGFSSPKPKSSEELIDEYKMDQFFNAYSSIKNILKKLYNQEEMPDKNVYLIGKNSIKIFIDKLKEHKIFENIHNILESDKNNEKNSNEEELKKSFKKFSLTSVAPKIYSNYQDCEKIFNDKTKKSDNEFIIVDEDFITNFKISDAKFKSVNIVEIKEKDIKIKFPITEKVIIAQEKKDNPGFFEFIKLEDNNENKIESRKELIRKDEENEKEKKRESMIKNICYCLINIDSLKKYFLINGDKVNNDNNKICKIFLEMINTNTNDELDCSKLIDIIKKESKPDNLKNVIEFIYNNLHEELVLSDLREKGNPIMNNNVNPQNFSKKESKISEIFYFHKVDTYICKKCKNKIREIPYINNHIEFLLKNVFNFKNEKKPLNIFDCFDYFDCLNNNDNNVNSRCLKCSNTNINKFQKIEPKNEILTIILDRGNNFQCNITFNLDYNKSLNLDNYLKENSKNQFEFELIIFTSYYPDENKFCSFYKNNVDNWYCFNGENINQYNNENLGIPVLLIYKKKQKEINKIDIIEIT